MKFKRMCLVSQMVDWVFAVERNEQFILVAFFSLEYNNV